MRPGIPQGRKEQGEIRFDPGRKFEIGGVPRHGRILNDHIRIAEIRLFVTAEDVSDR